MYTYLGHDGSHLMERGCGFGIKDALTDACYV